MFRQRSDDHAPGHAAEGVSGDVKSHGRAEAARVDFFRQIGHGDGGYAAQQHALQGAQDK